MKGLIHRLQFDLDPRGGHQGSSKVENRAIYDHLYRQKKGDFFIGRAYGRDRWLSLLTAPKLAHRSKQHLVIIGGTRAGKGRSVLMHNILDHPGNSFVVDPKGESAILCAEALERKGYRVVIIDPFEQCKNVTKDDSLERFMCGWNPLFEIDPHDPSCGILLQSLAEVLIKEEKGSGESGNYWREVTVAACRGLMGYSLVDYDDEQLALAERKYPDEMSLYELGYLNHRVNLCFAADFNRLRPEKEQSDDAGGQSDDPSALQRAVATYMAYYNEDEPQGESEEPINYVGETLRDGGAAIQDLMNKTDDPLGYRSLVTTLMTNFGWAKTPQMKDSLRALDMRFRMSQLKTQEKLAVFAVLPRAYIKPCAPWMKAMLTMAINSLELNPGKPKHPVNIIIDEAPQLGYMEAVESAFAIGAGSGARIVMVCQDLGQLKRDYGEAFETFIGNSAQLVLSVQDVTTTNYFSEKAGMTYARDQKTKKKDMTKKVRVMEADEIARFCHPDRMNALYFEGGKGPLRVKLRNYDAENRAGRDYRVHPDHLKPKDRLRRSDVKAIPQENVELLEDHRTKRKGKLITVARNTTPKRMNG